MSPAAMTAVGSYHDTPIDSAPQAVACWELMMGMFMGGGWMRE
jgi:hypothetical protein